MINIVTDSTADINAELAAKYGIKVVPLQVHLGGKSYKDGVDIDQDKLFRLVDEVGSLPQTAAPAITDFVAAFENDAETVYIGLSSKLSATIQTALLASENVGQRVRIIDSRNISQGIGLPVLKAVDLKEAGMSAEEIAKEISDTIPKVRSTFIIDTLKYLHMGGRCSAMQAIVGNIIKLRPIIEAKPDGTLGVKDKVRGKRQKCLEVLLDGFKADLPNIDLKRVAVGHAACEEDAEWVAGEIRKLASPEEITMFKAGSVISSHCGPKTVGLMYILK